MLAVLAQRVASLSPRRRLLMAGAAVIALSMLLVFLFVRTEAVEPEIRNRVMLNLRELEKLDAEWDANILRAHIGRAPQEPRLTTQLPRMHDLVARLGEALPHTTGAAAPAAYGQLRQSLRTKEQLVTLFAVHNPPLRDALMHVPPAVADLKTELSGLEGALAPARIVVRLDTTLEDFRSDPARAKGLLGVA